MTLYELTGQYKEIEAMIEDDAVDEQAFLDTLDSIDWEQNFQDKADAYVEIIRNIEVSIGADDGKIDAITKILDSIKASKAAKENKVKKMKENLCNAMIETNQQKFQTQKFSFWTQKTTPSVVIEEGSVIPMDYLTVPEPKADKKKIADALKNGEKLDFAKLEQHDIVRFK